MLVYQTKYYTELNISCTISESSDITVKINDILIEKVLNKSQHQFLHTFLLVGKNTIEIQATSGTNTTRKIIYIVGDFNNWQASEEYKMNISPDKNYFWITLNNLEKAKNTYINTT